MQQSFYSNGKLLLSGEYGILDGAIGLAVPTKFGQSLQISPTDSGTLEWKSFDPQKKIWFEAQFSIPHLQLISTSNEETSARLKGIFEAIRGMNGEFLAYETGVRAETHLSFPRDWGLGTSSTLINNIASWSLVDAHYLLEQTFGGSGYDISCAQYNQPILYQLENGSPKVETVQFSPAFKESLFFVYLNEKRNSREAISNYRGLHFDKAALVDSLSQITKKMVESTTLSSFGALMETHEATLSKVLGIPTLKSSLFPTYSGALKSLGAWGGDFVMATGTKKDQMYFKEKGYETILSFSDMVL